MAYPPEFSSTLTYANRYDLDEINVFMEGDPLTPTYLEFSGLPEQLSFGKHFFYVYQLDIPIDSPYRLRDNSRVLFEFKSANNVVLYSDVEAINQRNGTAIGFVDILQDPKRTKKEVEDGTGTFTVVASLEENTESATVIPEQFRDAMNYRITFPINIRKNLMNANSPILISAEHKRDTLKGQFSFVKANISPMKTSKSGLTYGSTGVPSQPVIQTTDAPASSF